MHAIVRINSFDERRLAGAGETLEAFQRLHARQPGYSGSLTVDLGNGRRLVVNLWESEEDAAAGIAALGPEVQRVLAPLMTLPSQLIGVGNVTDIDLVRPV